MKAFISAHNRRERALHKAYQAEVLVEQQRRKAKVRKLHRAAVKARRTTDEFDEYLWEWENENLETPADLATRSTDR